MKIDLSNLKRFERRVRLVRAWRGLTLGACAGALASVVWAGLDWMRVSYTEWSWMGMVVGVSALIGIFVGYFARIPAKALSDSIDRRGGLEDRLKTSLEVAGANQFESALHEDASEKVGRLKPKDLYPVRVGKLQGGTVALALLASAIFLLGNSPILLPPDVRKEREELKKLGESVERIAKPLTEHNKPENLTDAEKRVAEEMRKLQRDLMKSKIDKEETMQKANELAKQTKEIVKERAELTTQNIEKAESALEKLQKAELEKAGLKMDPEMMQALHEMNQDRNKKSEPGDKDKTDQQKFDKSMQKLNQEQKALEQKQQKLQDQKAELQKQMDKLSTEMKNPNLSPEQQKALEEMQKKISEMMKKMEKELAEIQKAIDKIMKNKEIQELIRKINEHPKMKELQELAAKLAANAKMGEMGEMPELSKEDIEAMKEKLKEAEKAMKELAKELADPAAMEEFMQQLKEALENMDQLEINAGMCIACLGLFNLPLPGFGMPSPSNPIDYMGVDTGKINKNENGKEGQGKTTLTQIKGQRQKNGEETYIEIKGPTTVGNRSGVKYTKVLPSYKKKAEEAMNKKTIPKQHEKRVREYFESLTNGK
ncbi:MAG: hypothetical protein H7Y17_07180 [Chlorobia bacterium]|nr:hypothetical protein [Fimbriimonadaceae bacterium]